MKNKISGKKSEKNECKTKLVEKKREDNERKNECKTKLVEKKREDNE